MVLSCICFRLHRKRAKEEKADSILDEKFVWFDFATITYATSNFSNRLGHGTCGEVYKGTLESGKEIAVKSLYVHEQLDNELFMRMSPVIARIQHTNLVKHLGICVERGQKFMVFEFLPNASLACLLLDPSKQVRINWETWYKIILGIAKGLEYLHEGINPRMLHRNLTTCNVLFDEDMNPKITDFGMSHLFMICRQHTNTCSTGLETYAYIAPEYGATGMYSAKADVYSFGVIVLETVSNLLNKESKHAHITDEHRIQARKLWDEDRLPELIKPALSASCPETDVIRCIQVGILCVQKDAEHRPTMGEVVLMLTGKVFHPAACNMRRIQQSPLHLVFITSLFI